MSYAEHGPRIFLAGRPSSGIPMTYGDYVVPKKRSEGRLKLYNSCTDIRAWSPNVLESTRYFRELNEHDNTPGKVVPFNVIIENVIGLTAQAQSELRIVRRELQKYKSLKLTSEQQKYLESLDKRTVEFNEIKGMETKPIIRSLFSREGCDLFNANKIVSLSQHSDSYLSIYFRPNRKFRYDRRVQNSLLTNTRILKENLNVNPLFEHDYRVSRITSCDILTGMKDKQDYNDHVNICIEYVDAFCQVQQNVCEMGVQTDEYKNNDAHDKQSNADSSLSQYYESSESVFTSESELGVNSDPEVSEGSHKRIIIQKDSEIIVLKNELGMKEDELEELRELNRHLQTLLKEKDENANILRRNVNTLQEKLKIVSEKRNDEVEDLSAKLSSSECLIDQLKVELGKKCQICYFQSQEIQKLRKDVKEAELISIENETILTRKVKEMKYLSKEAESCDIALEQVKNVRRERDMLQKQYREQSCTLADREDEIKRLLMLIKQMSVTAETREVEINDVVVSLRNDVQAKNDKISRCEMQLICMEREVGNLTNMLKNSLNNLDESKIAYEGIFEYTKCEHDTCLDVQSALSTLKAFIDELEECKLERRNRLREIDNLKACVACYSQESVSEITNADFDHTGHRSIQPVAEDISTSSNCDECHSSKELVNVQIQSDNIDTSTTCSDESKKVELDVIISYEDIDRALAMHIKRSIDKIHEISTVLQGAGDYHAQIVKEFAKQQQELQKKDLEITELKQEMERTLRRGEGDCMIQEQLKKKILEKEKVFEATINKRDSDIEKLREHLTVSENEILSYRTKCDMLKIENTDLVDAKIVLSKENDAQNEELKGQRDQICKLIQQIDDLNQTVDILKKETNNIDNMRKKLIDLQMKNNDLTNKLIQANEIISKNAEIIADLERKDENNRIALTHGSVKYDAMITQKHGDIVKLQEENQSLRDQLRQVEINLAQSNDTISLLRRESDNVSAMNTLKENLSSLGMDKEKLLAKVDYLRSEVMSCRSSTASIENELQALSHRNEKLKVDIETVRNTNDQLLCTRENTFKGHLRDALCILPGKIYERIASLQTELKEYDEETEDSFKLCRSDETVEIEGEKKRQRTKVYADKSCQQDEELYASRRIDDELDFVAQEVDHNSESIARKLRFLEKQYEEKLREIKNLMDDVKLRDCEIKKLQECITYLLQEKNDLQNKVKHQVEEYQSKLTLLKKKYDSSLNAFRERHNENVERLQTRYEDIMKIEKSPFDSENWLKSLNLKELTELHNRINILSSHAVQNTESNIAKTHHGCRNNTEKHKFYNKFTLRKECPSQNGPLLNRKTSEEKITSKILNIENNDRTVITDLYSRDQKFKQERRFCNDEKKRTKNAKSPKMDRTLDRQREKFIYQCSIHHKLNNAR